MYPITQ